MLLERVSTKERSGLRRWSLVGAALLGTAVVASGFGLIARAQEPAKKPEAPKPDEVRPLPGLPGLFPQIPFAPGELPGQMDDVELRAMQQLLQERQQVLNALRGRLGGLNGRALPTPTRREESRLGAWMEKPSATLVDQLELPKNQGQVVSELAPTSPAAKAGLKQHDILLELDGKAVPSEETEFVKLLSEIKADKPVEAVVLRKGRRETLKGLSLPEAKAPRVVENTQQPEPGVIPALPGIRGFNVPFPQVGGMTTMSRTNDEFTTTNRANGVTVRVTGKVENGKAQVGSITVESPGQTKIYENLEKVPDDLKPRVKALVEMAVRGAVRGRRSL
jgi:PDZ domain